MQTTIALRAIKEARARLNRATMILMAEGGDVAGQAEAARYECDMAAIEVGQAVHSLTDSKLDNKSGHCRSCGPVHA